MARKIRKAKRIGAIKPKQPTKKRWRTRLQQVASEKHRKPAT